MSTTQHNTGHDNDAIKHVIDCRQRCSGQHYKLSSAGTSLALDHAGQPYVNRKEMSARAIVSTATVDRVRDLLMPLGCQLTNYAKNPVVMWAHGLEGISQPIGTSRDLNGNLAIVISEDAVEATSWFAQSSLEAAQIFELIDEGIVRATSVRETPIKSRIKRDLDAGDIVIVEEWELEEWSWCAVGVNPDAVAKTLNRNRLGGQPITQSIVKSLTAVAPQLKRFGIGLPMEKTVTESNEPDNDVANAVADDIPDGPDSESNGLDAEPYGSTVVSAVHASLSSACQNIEDAMGPLENPAVKEGLQSILAALQEQITALEGLHSSSYPDQPTLKADDDSQDDGAMKAFLASGRVASLQVLGLGTRLKGLIGAHNLTPNQRRTLSGVSRQMAKLVAQSKARQIDGDDAKVLALQHSIQELTELVATMRRRN